MKQTEIWREARRLHKLGFAIHWLLPNSKRPVESGWTTGPRKEWAELNGTYRDGYNVGVRLGSPSKMRDGYLTVIDVDVKSKDPRHLKEAEAAIRELVGNDVIFPEVRSGRGNGSRHYYCLTGAPFKTFNPAASDEIVKVHMPSKLPSNKEVEQLTKAEIEAGMRLSRAWEISLYSDGRQVVLPPSIHPDTGKPYFWTKDLANAEFLPMFEFDLPESEETTVKKSKPVGGAHEGAVEFEIDETLDIRWLPDISDALRDLITKGVWKGAPVNDRSAYLLVAASGLASAGLSKDAILTVLTDRSTFLGECAYDHAKTENRKRAAAWVWKFTVKKVLAERNPANVFAEPIGEPVELSGDELTAQDEELRDKPELRGFYDIGEKGGRKPAYGALLREYESVHPYKTIADMKTVFVFNGTHYADTTPIEVKAFAEEKFNPKPEEKIRAEFLTKVLANNVTRRDFFSNTTEGKINFRNGVLDLNNFGDAAELLSHSPEYGFRGVLPYEYDPLAECPQFKRWLRGVMLADDSLIDILQEFMGYVIRGGEYKYHKALWLGGVGRNGKSTFIDLLKALIGPRNFSVISIKSLMNDKFAGADLDGKIANFSEETSPQELADSGPFKNLTGDGDLFAQKKFGDPYSFRNRAKLIMSYNTIPDLKDLSKGMLSRPIIIPFEKIIGDGEQDKDIKKKLFKELPGIFNFALEGWHRLEEQGEFTKSVRSELALEKIKTESCPVYQWVEDHIMPADFGESQSLRPIDFFTVYQRNERYPLRAIEFYRRMNTHPTIEKAKRKTNKGWVYDNLQIG